MMSRKVITFIMSLLCMDIVIYGLKNDRRDAKEIVIKDDKDDGEGTYNPKNAWMFVDSRRRVLPDIDVEAHFASVENNILSDIHNYHMVGQTSATEDNNEEDNDEYVISRFTPSRSIWGVEDDYGDDDILGEDDEYEDTEDTYHAESTNTVQSVRLEDRQLSTLGQTTATQPSTGWAQTFVNGSAVALLAFLFLLNLTQDVIAQITGKRRRRKRENEGHRIRRVLESLDMDEDG